MARGGGGRLAHPRGAAGVRANLHHSFMNDQNIHLIHVDQNWIPLTAAALPKFAILLPPLAASHTGGDGESPTVS